MEKITHCFSIPNEFYKMVSAQTISTLNRLYSTIQTIAKKIFSLFYQLTLPSLQPAPTEQFPSPEEKKGEISIQKPKAIPQFTNITLQKNFFQVDYEAPFRMICDHFTIREYAGYRILRKKVLIHPSTENDHSCDIVQCIKRDVQIRYDTNQFTLWDYFWNTGRVKRCMQRQTDKLPELLEKIQSQFQNWNYESFYTSADLQKKIQHPSLVTNECHQFFFFHREVPNC